MSVTYDTDFYAWANEQAALLRAGKLNEADIAHIAEEIEGMGKTEKRELLHRLVVLADTSLEVEVSAGAARSQLATDDR